MIVEVKRFDFVKGVVTTYNRELPNKPPATPLMDMLISKAAKKSMRPEGRK